MDREKHPTGKNSTQIPVLQTIPNGIKMEEMDIVDWVDIEKDMTRNGQKYVGIRIVDESMHPEYRIGDTIIIRLQQIIETGEDAVLFIGEGNAVFRHVECTVEGICLQPLNPAYNPRFITNREIREFPVRILGIAVEVRRRIGRS